ncbi:ribonuclease HII [Sandaracinobacteroides sp. A072]|uniref:ribonuclease HII n=1 Tax=Sandaracinobacteroides sp. A072 TaxID=3461146 RepID=UPI004042C30A
MGLKWGIEAGFGGLVFGVDEVGRGPWAGPVVAAACCLDPERIPEGLADSKALSAARRERIAAGLDRVAIAEASVEEIDRLNIRAATFLAMRRAVEALALQAGPPIMVLVDGNALPGIDFPARAIVRGDSSVASISAAAIAAKVARDRLMTELDCAYPAYGWARNKGYGTAEHQAGLARAGVSPHHRRSFAPVAKLLG